MATLVSDIINKSLTLIGVIAQGATPNNSEQTQAFSLLNDEVIDPMKNDPLFAYAAPKTDDTLTGGTQIYTYGPGGNFNHVRPVFIKMVGLNLAGLQLPIKYTTKIEEWQAIEEFTTGIKPTILFDDCDYPLRRFYFNPTPSGTPGIEVYPLVTLERFATVGDAVTIAPGYAAMLSHLLAIVCSGPFGMQIPPSVSTMAQQYVAGIRSANASLMGIQMPQPAMAQQGAA